MPKKNKFVRVTAIKSHNSFACAYDRVWWTEPTPKAVLVEVSWPDKTMLLKNPSDLLLEIFNAIGDLQIKEE